MQVVHVLDSGLKFGCSFSWYYAFDGVCKVSGRSEQVCCGERSDSPESGCWVVDKGWVGSGCNLACRLMHGLLCGMYICSLICRQQRRQEQRRGVEPPCGYACSQKSGMALKLGRGLDACGVDLGARGQRAKWAVGGGKWRYTGGG